APCLRLWRGAPRGLLVARRDAQQIGGLIMSEAPLLDVAGLVKHFPVRKGVFSRVTGYVKAVDGVSFAVPKGKTLSLVGESGSGKTTAGRAILRLIEPSAGRI